MNLSMQLAVVVAAACLCLADGAPDGRLVRTKQQRPTRGFKNVEMMTARGFGKRDRPHTRADRDVEQPSSERVVRSTPTFKSGGVSVARDFGKRSTDNEESYEAPTRKKFNPKNSLMVANDFGKRSGNDDNLNEVLNADDFLEILDTASEKEMLDNTDDKTGESIPVELFVMEMLNHPEFARSVVTKFVDINQDGMLSLEELLRNSA